MTDQPTATHEMWEELAAGHALHALEPGDEQRFLTHLSSCEQCVAALDDYNLVAAQLGSVADNEPDETPNWQQIRAGIIDDRPARVVRLDRSRRLHSTRILAAAAAVVTVTAVGVAGLHLTRQSSSHTPTRIAALSACEHQVGCRAIRLHAPDGANPAAVVVNGDRAAVVPLTLSRAPAGRTYVLWQMPSDGSPIPVSEFRATDRQTASTPLPASYADTAAFAISLERSNVAPRRPSDVLAVGTAT
jgi:anti-sigma-K factor RskA